MLELAVGMVAFVLRDVARNGNCRTSQLLSQPIKFMPWKPVRDSINMHSELHGFLPNPKIFE